MKSLLYLCVFVAFCSLAWSKPPKGIHQAVWDWCNWMDGFTSEQLEYCLENPRHTIALMDGGSIAYDLCQQLFQHEKWNCSQGVQIKSHMQFAIKDGSREDALLQALQSAGMTYEVTLKCSQGKLPNCGCRSNRTMDEVCYRSVNHAVKMVNNYLKSDVATLPNLELQLMALHNIRVGQQAVKRFHKLQCTCNNTNEDEEICHCYKHLPPTFHPIGKHLQSKYRKAHQVMSSDDEEILVYKNKQNTTIHRRHMIYLNHSKDPCTVQSPQGRPCLNPTHCDKICCNRGWKFVEEELSEECNCTLTNTLEMECETCTELISEHQCK